MKKNVFTFILNVIRLVESAFDPLLAHSKYINFKCNNNKKYIQ